MSRGSATTPTPASHRFIALDLLPKTDAKAFTRLMRVWTSTISALMAGHSASGDAAPDMAQEAVSLTVTVGYGPGVLALDGLKNKAPAGFQPIPAMDHEAAPQRRELTAKTAREHASHGSVPATSRRCPGRDQAQHPLLDTLSLNLETLASHMRIESLRERRMNSARTLETLLAA